MQILSSRAWKHFLRKRVFLPKFFRALIRQIFARGMCICPFLPMILNWLRSSKLSRERGYTIGEDIGIISYNDTPVKEVLEGGITVITTDFEQMGKKAAQLLLNKETQFIANPTQLTLRNSL